MQFDLMIEGGLVVDGTGAPGRIADVGIQGDRIAAIGQLDGAVALRRIAAHGKVVAPGFIDVHSHAELVRLGGIDQFCGIQQGVTTELLSPDGFSWAPMSPERRREMREYLQVFYGDDAPIAWDFRTVADYLSLFPGRIPGNLVPQVPHVAIKVEVMGWETRPASREEIDAMKPLVREWLDAGAVSLATGLEYQPTSYASLDELVELSKLVAERGGIYVTHQRGYWYRLERGTRETYQVGREAGIPVHISHLAVEERTVGLLADGQADGIDVSLDMYPYTAACTHLMMMLPEWAQIGGYAAAMGRLNDPAECHRMREETALRIAERGAIGLAGVEHGPHLEGRTLHDVALEAGQADVDMMFALLRRHNGRILAVYHWEKQLDVEGIVRRTLSHPLYVGCTDGLYAAGRPHPRGFGSFPRIVGDYVRDGTLRLEQAVRKVTGYAAERFRIRDRGRLLPGLAADVVIFDAATVTDRSSYANGRVAPAGIEHVLVNGAVALADGRPTGNLAGRVVKGL
jgi:N-acyl-D-amino-acid deacylase